MPYHARTTSLTSLGRTSGSSNSEHLQVCDPREISVTIESEMNDAPIHQLPLVVEA